jgi:Mrp family chromosome partitioning ATPase
MNTERPAAYAVALSMSANGSDTDTFSVPVGEEFELLELVHKKTGACDLDEVKAPTENMLNQGFPVELMAGDAVRRLPLPSRGSGWIIKGGTTVTVKATDRSGAANVLDLVFLGVQRLVN